MTSVPASHAEQSFGCPPQAEVVGTELSTRRLLLWLVPAVLWVVYYELLAIRAAGAPGFPLDDAWIHAQFARNIATGHGFTYTGDRWIAGSTSPAWTLLLAIGYFITRDVVVGAKLVGVGLLLVCGVLSARLATTLTGRSEFAPIAGLTVALIPAMAWGALSGMELGLTTALVLGGFCVHTTSSDQPKREMASIALFSAACLARPETLVLLGLVALDVLARAWRRGTSLRTAVLVGAVAAGILGPFVFFDYVTTGKPLPTTFYAKSGPGLVLAVSEGNGELLSRLLFTHGPDAVSKLGETLVAQFGALSAVILLGTVTVVVRSGPRTRGGALIVSGVVLTAFAMGLVAPMRLKPENFRYTAQLVSLVAVLGVTGVSILMPFITRPMARLVCLSLVLGTVGQQSIREANFYATSVTNIQHLQVALGQWMQRSIPAGSRVAVNDIGALAYFSGHHIIDLEGLVSPEALAYPRPERGIGFTRATEPDFIAIFPFWYPDISSRPDLFPEVHRQSISGNVVSAGDTLVVYSTPWTRFPLRRHVEQPSLQER